MATDAAGTSAPQTPGLPLITIGSSGLKSLELFKREIAVYLRELPRLLDNGLAWKHAVVAGDEILSIWDTEGDAIQAAREKFGPDAPIYVKSIDPRDTERFAVLKAQLVSSCPF